MRYGLTLAMAAGLVGGSSELALAQPAVTQRSGGGIAGTAIGGGAKGITALQIPLATGTGRFGVGTGGTELGVGNVTGGINGRPRAGSGGIGDLESFGSGTGGVQATGRGFDAGTGGIADLGSFGQNTGGIAGSRIGAGTGGIGNLNSLGADTGGLNENNAQRFPIAR